VPISRTRTCASKNGELQTQRVLLRRFDIATASRPLRGNAWKNQSAQREDGSGDETGDIIQRYTWI